MMKLAVRASMFTVAAAVSEMKKSAVEVDVVVDGHGQMVQRESAQAMAEKADLASVTLTSDGHLQVEDKKVQVHEHGRQELMTDWEYKGHWSVEKFEQEYGVIGKHFEPCEACDRLHSTTFEVTVHDTKGGPDDNGSGMQTKFSCRAIAVCPTSTCVSDKHYHRCNGGCRPFQLKCTWAALMKFCWPEEMAKAPLVSPKDLEKKTPTCYVEEKTDFMPSATTISKNKQAKQTKQAAKKAKQTKALEDGWKKS